MFDKRAREQYGLGINSGPFGLNSRPALIADKYLVMGAQPYDTLKQVIEKIQEEEKDNEESAT